MRTMSVSRTSARKTRAHTSSKVVSIDPSNLNSQKIGLDDVTRSFPRSDFRGSLEPSSANETVQVLALCTPNSVDSADVVLICITTLWRSENEWQLHSIRVGRCGLDGRSRGCGDRIPTARCRI